MKVDPFIEAEKVAGHSVKRCCELLEVSRAAFYERLDGTPSKRDLADAELTERITAIHDESNHTYGSPRVHKELRDQGVACGRRRVRRLMRLAGLEGRCKKRWRKTTVADPEAEKALDLIQRAFGPGAEIDRRYVGDITYIATWEGWAYLATVIDLSSRRIVGWVGFSRFDGHPTSGAEHRKGCPLWGPWSGRHAVTVGRSPRSSKLT